MSVQEVRELKKRVLETDISVNNPGIQQIIENELIKWEGSYNLKKTGGLYDYYGKPGEIPDQIEYEGKKYSPTEILEHVKSRDALGMSILNSIDSHHRNHPQHPWPYFDPRRIVTDIVKDDTDLDQMFMNCMCGQHNKSYRIMMEDVINLSPDSVALTFGWADAVMNLYREPPFIKREKTFGQKIRDLVSSIFYRKK